MPFKLVKVVDGGLGISREPTKVDQSRDEDVLWVIEALEMGDDSCDRTGNFLRRKVLYASAKLTRNLESYHAVDVEI